MKRLMITATLAVAAAACWVLPQSPAKADVMVSGQARTMCMDVNRANDQVILYGCHGGENQDFFTQSYGQQRLGSKCLDQESEGQGSKLVMRTCANSPGQRWALLSSREGGGLRNERGYCADIPAGNASAGVNLVAWTCNRGHNQVWGTGKYGNNYSVQNLGILQGLADLLRSASPGTLFNSVGKVIATGGGNVIATGGGNVIATGGGNVIATGGGNLIRLTGGSVIATGGGN
jgi:hypothetical protein